MELRWNYFRFVFLSMKMKINEKESEEISRSLSIFYLLRWPLRTEKREANWGNWKLIFCLFRKCLESREVHLNASKVLVPIHKSESRSSRIRNMEIIFSARSQEKVFLGSLSHETTSKPRHSFYIVILINWLFATTYDFHSQWNHYQCLWQGEENSLIIVTIFFLLPQSRSFLIMLKLLLAH